MVCLGLKPGAAEWKVQTNPLSYGGTQLLQLFDIGGQYSSLAEMVSYKKYFFAKNFIKGPKKRKQKVLSFSNFQIVTKEQCDQIERFIGLWATF